MKNYPWLPSGLPLSLLTERSRIQTRQNNFFSLDPAGDVLFSESMQLKKCMDGEKMSLSFAAWLSIVW